MMQGAAPKLELRSSLIFYQPSASLEAAGDAGRMSSAIPTTAGLIIRNPGKHGRLHKVAMRHD